MNMKNHSVISKVVKSRQGFRVIEPEDYDLACIRNIQWWNIFDIIGVCRYFYLRYSLKLSADEWWWDFPDFQSSSWENKDDDIVSRRPDSAS